MNFNQHAVGGLSAGLAVGAVALGTGAIRLEQNLLIATGIFGLTLFMSFFPDVDAASIPQRWFFRGVLCLLGWLYFSGNSTGFVLVSFLSPLPLIHKHRGWTHWKITPWIIFGGIVILLEYEKYPGFADVRFDWDYGRDLAREYWIYGVACVTGHYTHLILDAYPKSTKVRR